MVHKDKLYEYNKFIEYKGKSNITFVKTVIQTMQTDDSKLQPASLHEKWNLWIFRRVGFYELPLAFLKWRAAAVEKFQVGEVSQS